MSTATATPPSDRRATVGALWALLGFTLVVAGVTFVLSFSGLDDYGRRVAALGKLAFLVPIGVDGLTLCAVAATFLLRRARMRVRMYAWLVFAIAVSLSVAGNLSHAAAKGLSWEGHIGSAAWPVLLALASHLLIVVRRHMESDRPATDTATAGTPAAAPGGATPNANVAPPAPPGRDDQADTEPSAGAPPRRPRATRVRPPAPGRDNDLTRQRARDLYRRGTTDLAHIARSIGVSKRSVERYTEDLRHPAAGDTPDPAADDKERQAVNR